MAGELDVQAGVAARAEAVGAGAESLALGFRLWALGLREVASTGLTRGSLLHPNRSGLADLQLPRGPASTEQPERPKEAQGPRPKAQGPRPNAQGRLCPYGPRTPTSCASQGGAG